MPQIGTIKVNTDSGIISIPIYDTTDLHENYVRVETASGVGAIPLRDISNAAYDFMKIETESGTKAVHDTKGVIIDDVEDGDVSEWENPSSSSFNAVSAAAFQGNYGIEEIGYESQYSISGLPRYPHAGDTFETYFQIRTKSTDWFLNVGWGASDSSTGPTTKYRVRAESTGIYLQRQYDGNAVYSKSFPNVSPNDGAWVRVLVDWGHDATLTVTIEDISTGDTGSLTMEDYMIREGGIYLQANSNTDLYSDEWVVQTEGYNPAIDQFNSGNLDAWNDDSNSSLDSTERIEGQYGLYQARDNTAEASSLPSSSSNYDSSLQPETLPYYPEAGDEFMFWAKLNDFNTGTTALSKFDFGCEDYSSLGSYSVFFDWPNNYWRIEYDDPNNNQTTLGESSTLEVNTGSWYLYRVQWQSDGTLEAQQYDTGFNQTDSLPAQTDTSRSQGGVYIWTNANASWSVDNARTLQRGAL